MQLYYANKTRSYVPFGNFGDDLNSYVWEKFLPGIFDEINSNATFVGFGTLLNQNLPKFKKTIIFGTGQGFGEPPHVDNTWTIYCVRGPLTAKALDLPMELGIADPAILVNRAYNYADIDKKYKVSLIPYAWEMESSPEIFLEVCQRLNYFCIDPRLPVEQVLEAIASSELVITAAMHGAIVADSLRVPWISLKSNAGIPDFKWTDFCESLEMKYQINRMYRFSKISQICPLFQKVEIEIMVQYIRKIFENCQPQLSKERILQSRLDRLEEKIEQFKTDFIAGKFA
jgi:succinoglycan biosynthesis protein ExoV